MMDVGEGGHTQNSLDPYPRYSFSMNPRACLWQAFGYGLQPSGRLRRQNPQGRSRDADGALAAVAVSAQVE